MAAEMSYRAYRGHGTLSYDDGQSIRSQFVASQEDDGGIELTCQTIEPGIPEAWLRGSLGPRADAPRVVAFTGTTDDGTGIEIRGPLVGVRGQFSTTGCSENTFILTNDAVLLAGDNRFQDPAAVFSFATANLLFEPTSSSQASGVSTFQLDGVPVALHRLEDYTDRDQALKRSHGTLVTTEIRIPARIGFEAARILAGEICDLCSLARGTLVNWILCDVIEPGGQRVYSHHYPALARPYAGGLPLLDPRSATDLKAFLEGCLKHYRRLRDSREFRTVIHAMCEARGGGFLDTRSLICVSLLEHLIGKEAAEYGGSTVLPDAVFAEALPKLRSELEATVRRVFANATDDQLAQITGHVQGFNWTSPRRRLKRMAQRLGVSIPGSEIDACLATRNDLVHRLQFHTNDKLTEYRRLVWLLDLLVLALLGYDGPRMDARTPRHKRSSAAAARPSP